MTERPGPGGSFLAHALRFLLVAGLGAGAMGYALLHSKSLRGFTLRYLKHDPKIQQMVLKAARRGKPAPSRRMPGAAAQ